MIENALLNQLQQRLLSLADIDSQSTIGYAVQKLIAQLFQAQQSGDGIVTIAAVEEHLDTSIAALCVDCPSLLNGVDSHSPIVVFPPFIAFRRTYIQLRQLLDNLLKRQQGIPPSQAALNTITWTLSEENSLNDEQKIAAISAASHPFSIITGGAGTGKTTTLSKALELILLDQPQTDILLAAPTGKAAQRLNESLQQQLTSVHSKVRATLEKVQAQTLHRLLAVSEDSGRAYRNEHNPLACQVLAIDEASMIGSDLLMQVLYALPDQAKLILLGDANQLPPVNAISFFNDISKIIPQYSDDFLALVNSHLDSPRLPAAITENPVFSNQICPLTLTNRFADQSVIEQAATALLSSDTDALLAALTHHRFAIGDAPSLYRQLCDSYPVDRQQLLENLQQRMILCANRQGPFGSDAINRTLDTHFSTLLATTKDDPWYSGRQILIEKNYPDLNLSNGDIGRCQQREGQWWIYFEHGMAMPVALLPPRYSLAFAITIHKSQGSEYPRVDIVLDQFNPETPNPLVSVPLVYTAITRAKETVYLYGDDALLQHCCQAHQQQQKPSAIVQLLKNPG